MNWDALGAIAELLGAIAVLMTLVYLAIQLRQNNAFAQAQAMQARTDTQINMISFVMSNPEYLNAIVALTKSVGGSASEEVSQEERNKATIALSVMRTTLENTFEQYKKGLIGRDFYEGVTVQTIRLYGRAILSLDLWLTQDFKREVEEILAKSPQSETI